MLKQVLVTALAAATFTGGSSAARADDPTYDCGFEALQQDTVTGQNYEGVAWGYVVHPGGGPVSIRCYVTVNGTVVSSTGGNVVFVGPVGVVSGRVTFATGATDVVELCAEVTTPHGSFVDCEPSALQVVPKPLLDVVDALLDAGCLVTRAIGEQGFNILDTLVIDAQGDVYLRGTRVLDCPAPA